MINQLKELCNNRHSVRSFCNKNVDDSIINQILEVVQTAPSAGNLQAYEVVVVKDTAIKQSLAQASFDQNFISEAPVVLGFVALPTISYQRYGERGKKLYSIQDATIACTYAMLSATNLGLSSTWVGAFDDRKVKEVLKINSNDTPVALLPIGYAAEEPQKTTRRDLFEISREL